MLKKRIIPCLDIRNGRTVKGMNFEGIRDAGDPVELAKNYVLQGADELVFLDITATMEDRKTLTNLVQRIANEINIPFTVGGGINSLQDVSKLIQSGADKISINSSAVRSPSLISEIAGSFGSQCVVVAIDVKFQNNEWIVHTHGGKVVTTFAAAAWAREAERLGAGEILLTSMDRDGTKAGFALDITGEIANAVNIPVIASGGAGTNYHFRDLFVQTRATGGLAASIFHFGQVKVGDLKEFLKSHEIPVRI